ncbi:MAG: flagellar basal body rod protein FlgC [Armatimonadetes bacterium]|nr:flagellar basal body rod protein FlgC [Armatimonadota bacterium]
MSFFRTIQVSASALTAERMRMDVIASNLANANTTRTADGSPYRRRVVLFAPLVNQMTASVEGAVAGGGPGGVVVTGIAEDPTPPRRVYQPGHPDADAQGYVMLPAINPVTEMVDLMASSRAYEANVTALNVAKQLVLKALEIGRR